MHASQNLTPLAVYLFAPWSSSLQGYAGVSPFVSCQHAELCLLVALCVLRVRLIQPQVLMFEQDVDRDLATGTAPYFRVCDVGRHSRLEGHRASY